MRVLVFGPPGQKDEVFLMSKSANEDSYAKRAPPELSEWGGGRACSALLLSKLNETLRIAREVLQVAALHA